MSSFEARLHRTRRRARLVLHLGLDILTARADARALTPAAFAAAAALAFLLRDPPPGWDAPLSLLLFAALATIFLYDARWFVVPDGPVAVLALTGLWRAATQTGDAAGLILAAGAAWAVFRGVDLLYAQLRGESGLGQGDAILFGIAGLWLGFRGLPGCLLVAVGSALVGALVLARQGRLGGGRDAIPFGPHLALGFWIGWAVGPLEIG